MRQRCLDDGCAENITALAALLHDARSNLREINISSLDYAKAYDSVSHEAISAVLEENGLPPGFIRYVNRVYSNSITRLEVEGSRSEPIKVTRGVMQGDPLSSWLFCLAVNRVLEALPSDIGYELRDQRINALAYADDVILVASTRRGMQRLLDIAEETALRMGLALNNNKCVALSIVPAGKQKKYKVLTDPQFRLTSGNHLVQLTPSQEWRYLGVDFRPIGVRRPGKVMNEELDRLTRAPLKPQQRLKILRCYLVGRFYYHLTLAGATLGGLRAPDKQVRAAIRKWLRLPADIPTAYFHTSCRLGGLGIPSFTTTIPGLVFSRLSSLASSSSPAARAASQSEIVARRLL